MKVISVFINTNIIISLASVFLTLASQIQLGMSPKWHYYLFLIFFATLFEYNLHRIAAYFTNRDDILNEKYKWLIKNQIKFYFLMLFSILGLLLTIFFTKKEVLLILIPIAFLTIFYSIPLFKRKSTFFRLREIPFLKIFLIAFVWSALTILLPIISTNKFFFISDIILLFIERFLFIFAIALPFDIRDKHIDQKAGLKTLATLMGEENSILISKLSLILFLFVSWSHYQKQDEWFITISLGISTLSTFLIINSKKIRTSTFYHHGLLDGAMIFQGLLMLAAYYLKSYFGS